ncbi:MAG: C4-dicarboxylate ABC transporter permease [Salinicola sp.]|uniref:tripartite tricarboxylate transporter permease n=1 Tax=uncultured Salinicola sp. TaxID=1193542 RepID=UPI000C8B82AB|nr:tripartite tricarboxylate transporter permease [uncultured Salinicola sp.]MAM57785.1 C4-dicarboxylate ABC transporter permease [Salinicola sp.]
MFEALWHSLPDILSVSSLLAVAVGVVAGIFLGALPGLSATLGISVLLPFTFGMSPQVALGMMAGIYNGSMYGGAIPAILLRIPGTPAAVATTFDGYPMAQQGHANKALRVALVSSAIGGLASGLALMLLAPPLGSVTLMFGPTEIFWVSVFGILSIALLIKGNAVKGLISAGIGIFVATVGIDPVSANERFTFGSLYLDDGISVIVLLIGLYAMPPVIDTLVNPQSGEESHAKEVGDEGFFKSLVSMLGYWKTWLRASLIGIAVGILPGAGGSFGTFISYNEAKRSARNSEEWGKGEPEGVAAAETCNNADTAASMIPALTLGIPGTSVAAVMLGGFLIHGLQPGPNLFREHPDEVFGFMWQFLIASVMLLFLGGSVATRLFSKVLYLPRPLLGSIILSLMVVGAYSIHETLFDVFLMFGFGVFGYVLEKLKFPMAPIVLGVILGGFMEYNFRISMLMSGNDPAVLWSSAPSIVLIAMIVMLIVLTCFKQRLSSLIGKRLTN